MRVLSSVLLAVGLIATAQAQLPVEPHPDQHSMLQSTDPQLAANKRIVYDFWRYALVAHDMEKAAEFMHEDYIQHNPAIPTGRAAFMGFFGQMPQYDVQDSIDGLVAITAERDLVTMSFVRECADPRNPGQTYTTTWFDMFRVADGVIVEHWDYGNVTADDNPPDCGRAG
jgi:predicted SnoaL-like aldol condensation-catalyzing enzyme